MHRSYDRNPNKLERFSSRKQFLGAKCGGVAYWDYNRSYNCNSVIVQATGGEKS